ncbi:hypothetical protein [Streptomyces orinoci]|uniref:Uncharacterized protein n=1 Tax=Streptomyces orinoci TaxID=67339 RepID=A0ABV3K145_STRON|nr:hypothetical protein [Streptomyces orinoci]
MQVLTASADIRCPHQGKVQLAASQQKLRIAGQYALVLTDLTGKQVAGGPAQGCAVQDVSPNKKCTATVSAVTGAATKLRIGGQPALLGNASGLVIGVPGGLFTVRDPGQQKTTAV